LLDNIGLYSALRWQMAKSCEPAKLSYTQHLPEEELSVLPEAAIGVYRIVEEGITNVIKHAAARNAHLLVQETAITLNVSLEDDGIGMTAAQRTGTGTYGIAAMNFRASRLGGRLQWIELPERGTKLSIEVPLVKLLREPSG
jgi:signal transduction histidine kinase